MLRCTFKSLGGDKDRVRLSDQNYSLSFGDNPALLCSFCRMDIYEAKAAKATSNPPNITIAHA